MDYKKNNNRHLEDFGNKNYGAVGTARGFTPEIIQRAAGLVQEFDGGSYDPSFGHAWGDYPYGDDPKDQEQIINGIQHALDRLNRK